VGCCIIKTGRSYGAQKRNEITFIQTAYSYGAKENNKDIKIIVEAASKKR